MFKRSARKNRSDKHTHELSAYNIGAGLRRQVCRICGQVSIDSSPPTNVRSETTPGDTTSSSQAQLTVVIDAPEPVGLSWRSGERTARR